MATKRREAVAAAPSEPPATDELLSSFEKLVKRAATAREREQLRHVQQTLGLRENDALWLVLAALQYYESLYAQYPKAIAHAAREILGDVKKVADASIRASAESAKADLAKAVASVAREVAQDTARRQMTQWIVVGMALGAAIFASGLLLGVYVRG